MPPAPQPKPGPVSMLMRLALGIFALAIPLFGLWLVTALVASAGLGVGLALGFGLAVVVALPIAWDFWAESRWQKKSPPPARILSRADRIRLRIFTVAFVASALALLGASRSATDALATHGDWFLFGAEGGMAQGMRRSVGDLAGSLATALGVAQPTVASSTPVAAVPSVARVDEVTTRPETPMPPSAPTHARLPWPLPNEPHPKILRLTASHAQDIASVAAYIKTQETDPVQRVKAIHDFVVRHLTYETTALSADAVVPPQDAESVFVSRRATCDGFANLMVAIGERTGDPMVKILGRSRGVGSQLDGFYHAWVAAKLGGEWALIDPTWDAGALFGTEFNARYSTSYLFTPPAVFAYDHLPDDPRWSLTDPPMTMERFVAQPALSAHFAALGLKLEGVTGATVTANGQVSFKIDNPKHTWLQVLATRNETLSTFACVVPTQAEVVEVSCTFAGPGTFELGISANDQSAGHYQAIGFLRVVNE